MSNVPGTVNVAPVESFVKNIFGNYGKSLEKFGLYVLGILETTGVITVHHVSSTVFLGSIAAVLTGLHVSTPTPKSGPGQV